MECKYCKMEIDEELMPPNDSRNVMGFHWKCFQHLAMNGSTVITKQGEDFTALVIEVETERDKSNDLSDGMKEKLIKFYHRQFD